MAKPRKVKSSYGTPAWDARRLVKQADRLGSGVPEAQRACFDEGGTRCGLASCPVCRSLWASPAAKVVIERYGEQAELQWVTVTPAAGRVELDKAAGFDVPRFHELVRRKLREVLPKGTEIIGALDVSVNLHNNSDRHLQFHYHAFIYPRLDKASQKACSERFRRDRKVVFRPIVFQTLATDTLRRRAKYTFKWFHQRRSSFDPVTYDDGITVRPKAKKQRLKAEERVATHDALKGYVVTDLMLLMGVKRTRSANPFSMKLMKTGDGDASTR